MVGKFGPAMAGTQCSGPQDFEIKVVSNGGERKVGIREGGTTECRRSFLPSIQPPVKTPANDLAGSTHAEP